MESNDKLIALKSSIKELYAKHAKTLLFHGLHHVTFVSKKAAFFADSIGANVFIVESAGLVHDLNHVDGAEGKNSDGKDLRDKILSAAGYSESEITWIEKLISESHTTTRGPEMSKEAMALSDGDTLFKAIPITPILFAGKYFEESKSDIAKLSQKIIQEQKPLFDRDIYFYTDVAKEKYLHWAKTNLDLWINVNESLRDPDVQEVIRIARDAGAL